MNPNAIVIGSDQVSFGVNTRHMTLLVNLWVEKCDSTVTRKLRENRIFAPALSVQYMQLLI